MPRLDGKVRLGVFHGYVPINGAKPDRVGCFWVWSTDFNLNPRAIPTLQFKERTDRLLNPAIAYAFVETHPQFKMRPTQRLLGGGGGQVGKHN
jgi:hypothetical protein